ncbi:MAG: type II secretion system protein [Phycisphaerales bacterium]|nr:type II secretion system protein [Phycisphaerales bacterium]
MLGITQPTSIAASRRAPRLAARRRCGRYAFTLIELLVVIAITSLLIGILLPALASARSSGRASVCGSNIRQLTLANEMYADDWEDHFAPGAIDFRTLNRHRWHGTRTAGNEPFQPVGGSLTTYLAGEGTSRAVRACPSFVEIPAGSSAFERGCGGYGYNNAYVGTHRTRAATDVWTVVTDNAGAPRHHFREPARTVAFADAAFAADDLIEYSFIEARFHPDRPTSRYDPSIHFRHASRASAAWLDGHVSLEMRTHSWSSGLYLASPQALQLGWFGSADDNSLFSP